ncbi:MAG: tRNA (5-methylaminomethyl-2-thiouridine)(34)-methyltransferase MnmD [Saprospiraceae bacterium]|nr:tRNA (5-methylaminomethyl-2-thiouridine)(34)-methyltransferase MnmD [Saprospiraceae bacterium]
MHQLIVTEDGSHTLSSEKFGVTYHSIHGAIQESNHIFIEAGLKYICQQSKNISILEVGLGTGLNALLTIDFALYLDIIVEYCAIEAYPISLKIVNELNYTNLLDKPNLQQYFLEIHQSDWNTNIQLHNNFPLLKKNNLLENTNFKSNIFDLIYFDAFAPNEQPELWDDAIFHKLYNSLKNKGVLVTYCAKGAFKRILKSCGFIIENLPGPPGKREMVRAIKP